MPNLPVSPKATACVSQGIRIKGEVKGDEDLFVDGQIEGNVSLGNAVITIGPNAFLKADISAREVIVRGRVQGKLSGADRIQIWSTAKVEADLKADRIAIEEGAELHGSVEAGKLVGNPFEMPVRGNSKVAEASKRSEAPVALKADSSGAAVAGTD